LPLRISRNIAEHLADGVPQEKAVLIDAFAGVGGNAIAFARSGRWKRVYAIEKDPKVLACAKHNAKVYGVQDLISWYEGDCFEILPKDLADLAECAVIFASPPWWGKHCGNIFLLILTEDRSWISGCYDL
jgi:trimethylguanosine synthase